MKLDVMRRFIDRVLVPYRLGAITPAEQPLYAPSNDDQFSHRPRTESTVREPDRFGFALCLRMGAQVRSVDAEHSKVLRDVRDYGARGGQS